MHCVSGYPLYCAESAQRYHYYLPVSGGYATPWLWYDGNQHGSYTYAQWRSLIVSKMNVTSKCTVTKWGYYNTRGSGRLYVKIRNDSTGTMRGRIRFVLTEDSLYYAAPNGDNWHNHVARDYLPDTSGTLATLAPNDSITTFRDFTVQAGWNANRCKIVVWYQKDSAYADSTKPVYQAGLQKVTDLPVAIEEDNSAAATSPVTIAPNPCLEGTRFRFQIPLGSGYRIRIFDITGRPVRELNGTARSQTETAAWDRRDERGETVSSGVYLYRFDSSTLQASGKIVVR